MLGYVLAPLPKREGKGTLQATFDFPNMFSNWEEEGAMLALAMN